MQGEQRPESSYQPFYLKTKIEEMMKYGRPLTKSFSRRDRADADELRATMKRMYQLAVEIEKKYYRKTTAQELDVELEWLRHLVRMCADKDYSGPKYAPPLTVHQYETWSRYNAEIGNMLGGYIRSLNR